tara:strand:+ start:150 stop:1043 length:894 start_codon:yes stop_codon:yes gene_type:complete
MRRGQINNKSLILIFTVALFTILSYASDQYLIRQEDKFRDLNIEYNNLRTKIISYTSISQSLDDIEIEANNTIENFLRKRHIWIKSLILISSDYKISNRKKNKETFKDPSTAEYYIKIDLINDFGHIYNNILYIVDQLNSVYHWNYELFKKYFVIENEETIFEGVGLDFLDLDKIFNENIDEFYYKDIDLYKDILFSEKNLKAALANFTLKNWLDLNRFTILLIENLDNNIELVDENVDYVDKLTEEDEKILEDQFVDLKKVSFRKNYLILFSILSQILSLLFLLLLFRSFLMTKRN